MGLSKLYTVKERRRKFVDKKMKFKASPPVLLYILLPLSLFLQVNNNQTLKRRGRVILSTAAVLANDGDLMVGIRFR
jgi:hypothetical protein